MFKKLLPFVLLAFVTACTGMQNGDGGTKKPCHSCECCQSKECKCCKKGFCPSKDGKKPHHAAAGHDECPKCAKAARDAEGHQGMKH